ncbi:MFS transporter [Actinomadura algeriensis]|uniref:MFS family arabinose efflux permease n=1 Tax=Actinomadura algeriensis TaxID=1679523 RepID=A0ABR9K3K3_9ACTN|nr:MFS transporter [Actinomadura algeriensis]MBE1537428.1 putative MFS family arabinose efflux permease [Actinomadura algeriensis]
MRTYRELFRSPGFTPLFAASSAQSAALAVGGLALSVLVYDTTGSPLLAALGMFGPAFAHVVGALALLSAADRLPPRAAMAWTLTASGLGTGVLAVPGTPTWAMFAVVLGLGLVGAVLSGVRYGLLSQILPQDGYLIGRSVLNASNGIAQIAGFALGGALVAALSARGALLVAAGTYLLAASIARARLADRPPRAQGRPSPAETWRGNALLWSSRPRRYAYLAMWLPNGLIVGCEAVLVPFSPEHAGWLLALTAVGMLAGDVLTGRFVPRAWRARLAVPLLMLLAVPYLVFALDPAVAVAGVAVLVASIGYGSTLLIQDRLMALTPDEIHGQALGLHSSGMMTMQGVSAALAGTVAEFTSPATAMAALATVSIATTLVLAPGLRAPAPAAT